MPIKSVPDRIKRLKIVFDELCRANQWPPDLASNPSYPTILHVIRPQDLDDEYYRDLASRAFVPTDKASQEDSKLDNEILLRPRDQSDRLADGVVVYRIYSLPTGEGQRRSSGLQIVQSQTRQAGSVLGRVGVVEIIREELEKRLAERSDRDERDQEWVISTADLAHLIGQASEEAIAKFLMRLDRGEFVSEGSVQAAAKTLHIDPQDLIFNNQGIYKAEKPNEQRKQSEGKLPRGSKGSARSRRRRLLELKVTKEVEALKKFKPPLSKFSCSKTIYIHDVISALGRGDKIQTPTPSEQDAREQSEGFLPDYNQLISSIRNTILSMPHEPDRGEQSLIKAIEAIERAGFQLWFGEYEDRVPLEADSFYSEAKRVIVLALSKAGAAAPPITIDLSHTFWMGPEPEPINWLREP
jgi:hypothetical protein